MKVRGFLLEHSVPFKEESREDLGHMLWRSKRICIEKWLAGGDSELWEQHSKDREEEKKCASWGEVKNPGGHVWYYAWPYLSFAPPADAILLLAFLPLPSQKAFNSFTTHSLFYPHCSFLFGRSEFTLSKEFLGVWQMLLEPPSHPLSSPLTSEQLYRRVSCIGLRPTSSIFYSVSTFLIQGFLQSSETA